MEKPHCPSLTTLSLNRNGQCRPGYGHRALGWPYRRVTTTTTTSQAREFPRWFPSVFVVSSPFTFELFTNTQGGGGFGGNLCDRVDMSMF